MANTPAQNYDQALANVSALIANITTNPKPTYSIGGKTVSWTEYFTALIQQEEELNKARQRADGPFEIRSIGQS